MRKGVWQESQREGHGLGLRATFSLFPSTRHTASPTPRPPVSEPSSGLGPTDVLLPLCLEFQGGHLRLCPCALLCSQEPA